MQGTAIAEPRDAGDRRRQRALETRARRRRRALAPLPAALTLGISVTSLAAWQQTVNVAGADNLGNPIGSTLLSIELSTDGGTTWTALSSGQNGQLNFGTNARLLAPGDSVYASVLLRAGVGSRGANVVLNGGSVGSDVLLGALTYGARTGVPSASCSAAGYSGAGTTPVGLGSALSSGSGSTAFAVPAATGSAPGTAVGICFALGLPLGVLNSVGGQSTSPVWHFVATSV